MKENKWTKSNRLTEVIRHEVRPEIVGSAPGYSTEMLSTYGEDFEELRDGDTVWFVWITTRTGLDKESIGITPFASEEAANEAVASVPVGSIIGDKNGVDFGFKEAFGGAKSGYAAKFIERMFGAGDEEAVHFKCYEALSEAGVISKRDFCISEEVLEWLGDENIIWMKSEFGENWECVGELEYCINHFPNSSLATLAAKLFVAQFVTYDDFAAGYLTKEIEVICGGTEHAAMQSSEAKKKAGRAGGEASKARRLANLEVFMKEVEALASVVGLMSEDRILQEAREKATVRNPKMPKSPETLAGYEVALRSEEPFRSRFNRVFKRNA